MRVAIDASRTTVARLTGTERYALELLRALIRQNTQHDLELYFRDQPAADLFPPSDRVMQHVIPFPRAWTHLRFAASLWQTRPDVTFVPAHTLPLLFPGRGIVTVHDLGYKYFPQAHTPTQRRYLDWSTRYSANRATVILADSQATARDVSRFYGADERKTRVLYPGVTCPYPNGVVPDELVKAVREKYGLPEHYWLYVGTLQPRKNIGSIAQGYARWKQHHADVDSALVLAGGRGWLYDPAWTAGIDGVIETGFVDEVDKWALYAGARALLFPSLYEGFGFPVVEALLCGTPVICSNSSSLPELGGDVVDYVQLPQAGAEISLIELWAYVGDQLAAYMERLGDEAYLGSARERRREQARRFNWEMSARDLLAILDDVD
ncbi:MAG: glycosyltransferase family 4 protein [Anaerolineae bacterium]|nr:glycosyltransferase family 4 protein [Anaerolineae bacterium]